MHCVLQRWLVAVVATALLTAAHGSVGARAQTYTAKLVGGRRDVNQFGDLLNYYVYAEAGAVVNPYPAFEIYRDGSRMTIYNHSTSLSSMSWSVLSRPLGSTTTNGTSPVASESNNAFVLRDMVFDFQGRYNVFFNVSLFSGENMSFNRTIVVDPQPAVVRLKTAPSGHNGTALDPFPTVQLESLIGAPIKTSTAVARFTILSGPGNNTGNSAYGTNKFGVGELDNVILSLPGTYVCRVDVTLSNQVVISTSPFTVTVQKALPVRIGILQQAAGIGGFRFLRQPIFQAFDSKGIVHDPRTNITLSIGYNAPSFTYINQLSLGTLMGNTSVLPSSYAYTFSDLWIDMPGGFDIIVTMYLNGEFHLQTSFFLNLAAAPTYLVSGEAQVNTIATLQIYGSQPTIAHPIYFMVSNDECGSIGSDVVEWRAEATALSLRNLSIVPYISGTVLHLCMKPASQPFFTKLIQHYLPRFNEQYPYVDSFAASGVSECKAMGGIEAQLYHIAGWKGASEGRRYGCRLLPPVAGTVAPCTCPLVLKCIDYTSELFRPPGLDIGQCVCCTGWVMAIAGILTSLTIMGVLALIYFYV